MNWTEDRWEAEPDKRTGHLQEPDDLLVLLKQVKIIAIIQFSARYLVLVNIYACNHACRHRPTLLEYCTQSNISPIVVMIASWSSYSSRLSCFCASQKRNNSEGYTLRMHTCAHTHTITHTHTHTHVRAHVHACTRTHAHTRTRIQYMHPSMNACKIHHN